MSPSRGRGATECVRSRLAQERSTFPRAVEGLACERGAAVRVARGGAGRGGNARTLLPRSGQPVDPQKRPEHAVGWRRCDSWGARPGAVPPKRGRSATAASPDTGPPARRGSAMGRWGGWRRAWAAAAPNLSCCACPPWAWVALQERNREGGVGWGGVGGKERPLGAGREAGSNFGSTPLAPSVGPGMVLSPSDQLLVPGERSARCCTRTDDATPPSYRGYPRGWGSAECGLALPCDRLRSCGAPRSPKEKVLVCWRSLFLGCVQN